MELEWVCLPIHMEDLERGMGAFSRGEGGHCWLEKWGMGWGWVLGRTLPMCPASFLLCSHHVGY